MRGREAVGVWFQPRSLPLAGSRISLSEPNPSPFTYSTAGAAGGGGAEAEPATPGPNIPPGTPPPCYHLGFCLSFLSHLYLQPSAFQKPSPPHPKISSSAKTRPLHQAEASSSLL